jgi:hypothetical protein
MCRDAVQDPQPLRPDPLPLDHLVVEIPTAEGQTVVAATHSLSTGFTDEVQTWFEAHPPEASNTTHRGWTGGDLLFNPPAGLLKHGLSTNAQTLAEQMLAFVETDDQTARPFNSTFTGKVLEAWERQPTGSPTRSSFLPDRTAPG